MRENVELASTIIMWWLYTENWGETYVHFFSPEKIFQIFRDYNTIQRRRIDDFEKKKLL